jgi:hypothetical protein
MRLPHASSFDVLRNRALQWYLAALLVFSAGIAAAAWHYPGGYDWVYTVATSLGSHERNPEGRAWMAGALCLSMVVLWPCVAALEQRLRPSASGAGRLAIGALRFALVCFALLGAEGLLIRDLSKMVFKGHELLALAGFLGAYLGILTLLAHLILRQRLYTLPALLIASPLLAIGITQLWLYFEQRGLGWVRPNWREMGIPIWLSFAFWQWLAIGFLWAGLGLLVLAGSRKWSASGSSAQERGRHARCCGALSRHRSHTPQRGGSCSPK